jgi:hypothetical protein
MLIQLGTDGVFTPEEFTAVARKAGQGFPF